MTIFGFVIYIIGVVHSVAEDLSESEAGTRLDPSDKAVITALSVFWPVTRIIYTVNVIKRRL